MSKNKLKPSDMGLMMSVSECIRLASVTLEMCKDKHKRLRSIQQKQANKQSMEFFNAVVYHFRKLEESHEQALKLRRLLRSFEPDVHHRNEASKTERKC